MNGQTIIMQMFGIPNKSQSDRANHQFAHIVKWLMENTNERERDLIYLVENFNRAWYTNNIAIYPSAYDLMQLEKIKNILTKFELIHLLEERSEGGNSHGWDVT